MESKKLQTILKNGAPLYPLAGMDRSTCDIESVWAFRHDARIAHELMDPARKKPETPLEREQREVIRKLVAVIHDECASPGGYLLPTFKALDAAAPFLED